MAGIGTSGPGASGSATYPELAYVSPQHNPISEVGTWANYLDTATIHNGHRHNSSTAQNDEVDYNVLLAAGTWTVEVMAIATSNAGIITVLIDDASQGTMDFYAGSPSYNTIKSVTGITINSDGIYELKLKTATKNASASAYGMFLQSIELIRTGA